MSEIGEVIQQFKTLIVDTIMSKDKAASSERHDSTAYTNQLLEKLVEEFRLNRGVTSPGVRESEAEGEVNDEVKSEVKGKVTGGITDEMFLKICQKRVSTNESRAENGDLSEVKVQVSHI